MKDTKWRGQLRELRAGDGPGCDAVIASLPYFFGQPAGVAECREAVRSQPGVVAVEASGFVAGFLTVRSHFTQSAEITWMAVHEERRRRGIGRRLVDRLSQEMQGNGVRMVFVITLGPSVAEPGVVDGYAGTRAFYERVGFTPLKELDIWAPGSAGLVLVRAVGASPQTPGHSGG